MGNMTITAYKDEKFTQQVDGGTYTLMLNPDSLKWERSNQYNSETGQGTKTAPRYKMTPAERLNFDIVIDCTGVVDKNRLDLPSEIKSLSNVVYTYNGTIHRPNYVKINWGSNLAFNCVLTSFNMSYTFFKPDGTPLRAKVGLSFTSYTDPATLAKQEDKQSPDMTHLVTVVAGDDLPSISQRIYGSPKYYVPIAEFNGLNKFRQLQPGSQLIVPPLVAPAGGP